MTFENEIVGGGIIVLNLVPFIFRKPKYLLITAIVSLLMLFLLMNTK
ncbi:hypothetical protein HZA99_06580 [Candidatus Woesearchaeota archaeon]|nr:hypothetical protein [Candidatus Woesearchaeota archaeon]